MGNASLHFMSYPNSSSVKLHSAGLNPPAVSVGYSIQFLSSVLARPITLLCSVKLTWCIWGGYQFFTARDEEGNNCFSSCQLEAKHLCEALKEILTDKTQISLTIRSWHRSWKSLADVIQATLSSLEDLSLIVKNRLQQVYPAHCVVLYILKSASTTEASTA